MPARRPSPVLESLRRAYRLILGLAGTCIGLLAVLVVLLLRRDQGQPASAATGSLDVQQVVARLATGKLMVFDSHADADVGRVHQAALESFEFRDTTVSTNRFGMRERDYALPKPDGVVRVVLLGDSMIFGLGVDAEDRLGVHLERWLAEQNPGFEGRVECLHLGAASWNIQAEAAYLRRQLSDLEPDLVIQVIVPNDIEDSVGVRGFGAMASFSSQHRGRADTRITAGFPNQILGFKTSGLLRLGLDYEPQTRYRAAAADIRRLARAVEAAGGEYRLLVGYGPLLPVAWKRLAHHLDRDWVVYLGSSVYDLRYTISRGDHHWNREGHARIARLIYGLIVRDRLLPRLRPAAWPQADRVLEEVAGAGRVEAERDLDPAQTLAIYGSPKVAASIDFADLDAPAARLIHGGLDRQGRVSPYASLILRNDSGRRLRIVARALRRPELDGIRVRVFVDGEEVGDFELTAGIKLARVYPLPAAAADRPFLSVRFEADDYVYKGRGLQHCVVFSLRRIAIEPADA